MSPDHPDLVHPVGEPGAMRRLVADDVVRHAANLSGWQQQYDQVAAGAFQGEVCELWFDEVQVFRERTSHALRQRCRIRPGTVWCGLTRVHDGSRIEGRPVGEAGVMVCGSEAEFELLTPDRHDIVGIVVARSVLQAMAGALGQPLALGRLDHPAWLACQPAARQRLGDGLVQLLDDANTRSGHAHAAARRFAAHAVLEALLQVLAAPEAPAPQALSFERRRCLVRQACAWMETHPGLADQGPPTVPDLCGQLHVSRRTLQYAFETVVGQSPVAYLRSLRLNAARRDLLAGVAPTVQACAARHGFWSLSQFASDYRAQFAERPSDTLARAGHLVLETPLSVQAGPPVMKLH